MIEGFPCFASTQNLGVNPNLGGLQVRKRDLSPLPAGAIIRPWQRRNLPGALHYVTGICHNRATVFEDAQYCLLFLQSVQELRESWPFKLIAYVLMPDHCHLIVNPRDGRITDLAGAMKGLSARRMINVSAPGTFLLEKPAPDGATHQVWQRALKLFRYGVIA